MPSSSDEATPPQGPEIWSVPLDPNSEIAYNTVVDEGDVTSVLRKKLNVFFVNLSEGTALGDGGSLFSSLDVKPGFSTVGWLGRGREGWDSRSVICPSSVFRQINELMRD